MSFMQTGNERYIARALSRSFMTCLLTVAATIVPTNSWGQTRPPILEKIAKTYGIDSLAQVEAIRYTFNLQFPGLNLSRSWEWEPNTSKVTYRGKDKNGNPVNVTYMRSIHWGTNTYLA